MYLNSSTSLEINVLTATPSLEWRVNYIVHATTGGTGTGAQGAISSTGVTTLLAAASAGEDQQVQEASVYNAAAAAARVQIRTSTGTARAITGVYTLAPGELLVYSERDGGWSARTATGAVKTASGAQGLTGYPVSWYKVGTAPEAAGVLYSFGKDGGAPGAWSPGTPGLAGRVTDGTTGADAGCLLIRTPAQGVPYIARYEQTGTATHRGALWDYLWVNTGVVVTTTTAQTINSVAFPARDLNGTSDGKGVQLALLVTGATTNAGAVTTITVSYTNSDGVPGRTGTIPSFPATATVGTVVPVRLAAGDMGVRSVQSITLGTTLAAGSVSLLAYVELCGVPVPLANVGGVDVNLGNPGIRLYAGVCAIPVILPTGTGAVTIFGSAAILEVV